MNQRRYRIQAKLRLAAIILISSFLLACGTMPMVEKTAKTTITSPVKTDKYVEETWIRPMSRLCPYLKAIG